MKTLLLPLYGGGKWPPKSESLPKVTQLMYVAASELEAPLAWLFALCPQLEGFSDLFCGPRAFPRHCVWRWHWPFQQIHPLFQPAASLDGLVALENSQRHQHLFKWLDPAVNRVCSLLPCSTYMLWGLSKWPAAETCQAPCWQRWNGNPELSWSQVPWAQPPHFICEEADTQRDDYHSGSNWQSCNQSLRVIISWMGPFISIEFSFWAQPGRGWLQTWWKEKSRGSGKDSEREEGEETIQKFSTDSIHVICEISVFQNYLCFFMLSWLCQLILTKRLKVKVTQSCLTLCYPMDYNSPGQNTGMDSLSLLQGSSQSRDQTQVSSLRADSLPAEPQGKSKNTGVGCLSLFQGIFPAQESNWSLLHCSQILYQLSHQGSQQKHYV